MLAVEDDACQQVPTHTSIYPFLYIRILVYTSIYPSPCIVYILGYSRDGCILVNILVYSKKGSLVQLAAHVGVGLGVLAVEDAAWQQVQRRRMPPGGTRIGHAGIKRGRGRRMVAGPCVKLGVNEYIY